MQQGLRCWPSSYTALPDFDANANAIAIQSLTLQNEGWKASIRTWSSRLKPDRRVAGHAPRPAGPRCRRLSSCLPAGARRRGRACRGLGHRRAAGPVAGRGRRRLRSAGGRGAAAGRRPRPAAGRAASAAVRRRPRRDATCAACDKPFELRFSLRALAAGRASRRPDGATGGPARPLSPRRPAVPAAGERDLAAAAQAAGPAARDLLAACVVEGYPDGQEDAIEEAMPAPGPVIDLDIEARCPHCGVPSALRLEMGSYFLKCLANERRFLLRENSPTGARLRVELRRDPSSAAPCGRNSCA